MQALTSAWSLSGSQPKAICEDNSEVEMWLVKGERERRKTCVLESSLVDCIEAVNAASQWSELPLATTSPGWAAKSDYIIDY